MLQSSRKSVVRRLLGGVVLAVLIGGTVHQVMYPNLCKGLTMSDWAYWQYSCWAMAVDPSAPSAFLVR